MGCRLASLQSSLVLILTKELTAGVSTVVSLSLKKEGFTALIAAASAGHIDCVKLLLDRGAEVNTADPVSIFTVLDPNLNESVNIPNFPVYRKD